ncbi:metallophosphoesterase family protein [Salisediminibacterium selenitireducens]|uniref:Phosphoesterase n=1 Tax=Bacillus selenitireducens (strain ATCC 700615 / DSM 15326 / MLS10) TaxID=439292 RepID=D6XSY9_BACIE|nr:metallophosphoesterase [Salisediminibacterium selenitireducens]ADH98925.1 phosphodiesterase, MJ0936 family [[Bacillus] selenitireducens MLS10]
MKALILSDSHGWKKEVATVRDRHQDEVDVIFHCGDSELPYDAPELKGIEAVGGNCDLGSDYPDEIVTSIGEERFFAGHGHLFGIKMSELNLVYKGMENDASICLFGHTHQPVAVMNKGLLLVNPGSMREPRGYPTGSYAIIESDEETYQVRFFSVDGQELGDLSKTFPKE